MSKYNNNNNINSFEKPFTVAIVGRPNVGKSSLFNAILKRRLAIVHEMSGVTRDRIMAPASFKGKHFQIVDTGGLGVFAKEKRKVDRWDQGIRTQIDAAIEDADALILVVNVQEGICPLDKEVAKYIRKTGKQVYLAANKVDDPGHERLMADFTSLGFKNMFPISCLHRRGIEDLLYRTVRSVKSNKELEEENKLASFNIAVVGRPNVGKSSMVNRLIGEDRVMVSEVAGTTRDSVDIDFHLKLNDEEIKATLIDTAGLRKKAKVSDAVEMFSVMRANDAIKRANLILFLIEASKDGVTAQDKRIAALIQESGKGCVIVANKWDECKKVEADKKVVLDEIKYQMPQMNYAPVVFASAMTGFNMDSVLDYVAEVKSQSEVSVPTSVINKAIEDAFLRNSPPVIGPRPFKIYYSTMINNEPPHFVLFVNSTKYCAANYLKYLNNYFRDHFQFLGWPIRIELRDRPKKIESIRSKKTSVSRSVSPEKRAADKRRGIKGSTRRREAAQKRNKRHRR
ncbi:ribosome biogenesis GTPase Der [Lentisphaerota bacterium WC36G]|nr:ribosome biogenesis GTPase Der [Lentisphaerae bacterium WC36]